MEEGPWLLTIESAIVRIVQNYPVTNPEKDKVMFARTSLFSGFGRLVIKVGQALEVEVSKAKIRERKVTSQEKESIVTSVVKGELAEIEAKYRKNLVEAKSFDTKSLPAALNSKEVKDLRSIKISFSCGRRDESHPPGDESHP